MSESKNNKPSKSKYFISNNYVDSGGLKINMN